MSKSWLVFALITSQVCFAGVACAQNAYGRYTEIKAADVNGSFGKSCDCRWETHQCEKTPGTDPGANFPNNVAACICKPHTSESYREGICYQYCPKGQMCNRNGKIECGDC